MAVERPKSRLFLSCGQRTALYRDFLTDLGARLDWGLGVVIQLVFGEHTPARL
jgi:hypothetical protein